MTTAVVAVAILAVAILAEATTFKLYSRIKKKLIYIKESPFFIDNL